MEMSPERRWALDLYAGGSSYDEIEEQTGVPRKVVYQLVYREVEKGKMQPAKKPPEVMKRKVLDTVQIGYLGREFRSLGFDDVLKIASKIKQGETLTDALIRIALRGK